MPVFVSNNIKDDLNLINVVSNRKLQILCALARNKRKREVIKLESPLVNKSLFN